MEIKLIHLYTNLIVNINHASSVTWRIDYNLYLFCVTILYKKYKSIKNKQKNKSYANYWQ